jgi:hypothetical protein
LEAILAVLDELPSKEYSKMADLEYEIERLKYNKKEWVTKVRGSKLIYFQYF